MIFFVLQYHKITMAYTDNSHFRLQTSYFPHIISKIHRYRPNFRLQISYFMLHTSILTLMSEERKTSNEGLSMKPKSFSVTFSHKSKFQTKNYVRNMKYEM